MIHWQTQKSDSSNDKEGRTPLPSGLPGDLPQEEKLARIIRVDQAGEYGAQRIYAGQLAVMKARRRAMRKGPPNPFEHRADTQEAVDSKPHSVPAWTADSMLSAVEEMARQEDEHKETFDRIMVTRRVRPTALAPLWHVGGWMLGAGTALLGDRAAMACTVAVESVISDHYAQQLEELGGEEPELRETIAAFKADEEAHHDEALAREAEKAPGYPLLLAAVKTVTRTAIALSKRI